MEKINYKFSYKGKIYSVDFLDFINKTVGFRIVNDKLEIEGVFVKEEEGTLIIPLNK